MAENDQVPIKKSLTKQEYVIADSTGCCKITTWGRVVQDKNILKIVQENL